MSYFPEVKKNFGFGCMRLPRKGPLIDYEQSKQMIDTFLEAGFNYFDTAHGYMEMRNEATLKKCLTSRHPRESYILANKLSEGFFKKESQIRPLFEKQLKNCGVEYFDFYLMHAQNATNFEKYKECRAYETAFELKKEEIENAEGVEDESNAGALDENGNPIEKNDNTSVNEENHAGNDTSNREEGSTDVSIDESNGDTSVIEPEQNPDNTTEPINPNTQAPDEVLKSEAEQEFNPVEELEDITDAGAQLPETPEGSAEQPPVTEESVQSGGIPGEVLKSDVE